MRTLKIAVAAFAVMGSLQFADVSAQGTSSGYLTDTRGAIVKDPFNLCWRTGYWSPALAVAECDPDLVPKPPMPAPRPAATMKPRPAAPAPMPVPAAKPAAKPGKCDAAVTLKGDEVFAFNTADLNAAARAQLDKSVLSKIRTCARLDAVVIEGHTDRLGSQRYNQKLSERRAESVKKYLVSKGVSAGKIETLGMGKTVPAKFCPKTRNRNELIACLAPSRRAIVFIKGPAR